MSGTARRFSDGAVRLTGLTDHSVPSAPVAVTSLSTCTCRLYDGVRRTRITATLAPAGTVLSVASTAHFAVGDAVQIRLDDTLTLHDTTIASLSAAANTITLAAGIPASRSALKGGYLLRPIGAAFNVTTTYGTPVANGHAWGYIGFYDDTLDLFNVESVLVEIDCVAAAGKRLFKSSVASVVTED